MAADLLQTLEDDVSPFDACWWNVAIYALCQAQHFGCQANLTILHLCLRRCCGVSASDMEVTRSEKFCQAITCSENCSLVNGKGIYIRNKQSELKILIHFHLQVPKLRFNCLFFFKKLTIVHFTFLLLPKSKAETSSETAIYCN